MVSIAKQNASSEFLHPLWRYRTELSHWHYWRWTPVEEIISAFPEACHCGLLQLRKIFNFLERFKLLWCVGAQKPGNSDACSFQSDRDGHYWGLPAQRLHICKLKASSIRYNLHWNACTSCIIPGCLTRFQIWLTRKDTWDSTWY